MIAKTKTWRTPELSVLVRSRPEESVLAACKTGGSVGPSDPSVKCKKSGSPCNLTARS